MGIHSILIMYATFKVNFVNKAACFLVSILQLLIMDVFLGYR